MIAEPGREIQELLERDDLIEEAVSESVREALRQHAAAGVDVAEWQDGRVVLIQADATIRLHRSLEALQPPAEPGPL